MYYSLIIRTLNEPAENLPRKVHLARDGAFIRKQSFQKAPFYIIYHYVAVFMATNIDVQFLSHWNLIMFYLWSATCPVSIFEFLYLFLFQIKTPCEFDQTYA